jgi:hypothetical protein
MHFYHSKYPKERGVWGKRWLRVCLEHKILVEISKDRNLTENIFFPNVKKCLDAGCHSRHSVRFLQLRESHRKYSFLNPSFPCRYSTKNWKLGIIRVLARSAQPPSELVHYTRHRRHQIHQFLPSQVLTRRTPIYRRRPTLTVTRPQART